MGEAVEGFPSAIPEQRLEGAEPGWVLELRDQGGLSSGGNISLQMLSRAPGSMAGWLLSVSKWDRGTDLLLSCAAALD